jgi:hypothetical protein
VPYHPNDRCEKVDLDHSVATACEHERMMQPAPLADFDWSGFLTGDSAPWWSTLAGVLAGGLLTYFTSSVIEKRRLKAGRETRQEDAAAAARDGALDLVAKFLGEVEALRVQYYSAQHQWRLEHPDYVAGTEAFGESWPPEVYQRYAALRLATKDDFLAANTTYSAIRLLPFSDLNAAARDVMGAVGELKPSNNDVMHRGALEALEVARHVLLVVAKNLFHGETLTDSERDVLFETVKSDVHARRPVVGEDPGIKEILVPVGTNSAILPLAHGENLQSDRAMDFVASQFTERGYSAAVFEISLMDGSSDFYAIGLETEGEPVTNVPDTAGSDVDEDGVHLVRPGSLQTFLISEDGEIIPGKTQWFDGSSIGVSPEPILSRVLGRGRLRRTWRRVIRGRK